MTPSGRIYFETDADANEAASTLRALGGHARKLFSQCIAAQGVTRKTVSQTALALENAGFVFVRDKSDVFELEFEIRPSLAGEEALDALEQAEESKA